jgi:hypothetical protein
MRPAVITLGFHLENQKIIMAGAGEDPADCVDDASQLERYFRRPSSEQFSELRYCEYYARYVLRATPDGHDPLPDNCQPVHFASERNPPAIAIIRTVLPH